METATTHGRMNMGAQSCPLDGRQKVSIIGERGTSWRLVKCPLCGSFKISAEALRKITDLEKDKKDLRHLVICYCREKWELEQLTVDDANWGAEISEADVIRIAEGKDPDVATTADRREKKLLMWLNLRSRPGSPVDLDQYSAYPIAYARDAAELIRIVMDLHDRRLLRCVGDDTLRSEITVPGQKHIEAACIPNPLSTTAFVAMSLQPEHSRVHEDAWKGAIKPAIEAAGWRPYRVDVPVLEHKICDAITQEIRNSRFMVADVTGERPCVYYEAGYAMGAGIKVIWTAEEGTELHFDSNHYQHIIWRPDALDKFRTELERHIRERIRGGHGR